LELALRAAIARDHDIFDLQPHDAGYCQMEHLVADMVTTAEAAVSCSGEPVPEKRLVQVRLGAASGLFAALRHKHPATAAHSLRVALGCSSWAFALGLEDQNRDELEVAALLHDIGKIGVPDRLLLKPGLLADEEAKLVDQFRVSGLEILATCCPTPSIVEIIRHSAGWFDGSRANYPLAGTEIPLGARMLAVVDAFDSMTSDQAYRHALSRERALHELFAHAGTQFDPGLVRSFSELRITAGMHNRVRGHWLEALQPEDSNRFWGNLATSAVGNPLVTGESVFQQKLLDNMHDAVIFVNRDMQIIQWNRGAERLTGASATSVLGRVWAPSMVGLRDEHGTHISTSDCPVACSMSSGIQSLRRLMVAGRDNTALAVDAHMVPIVGPDGAHHGAAMLLHDVSLEASLEERCQSLHERATRDPLTQVANRAEFDRAFSQFVQTHQDSGLPCSLIICDIDDFKSINDTYGHQAGDEVLKFFGHLLKSDCRAGDLVARYGGEEFVILCADCTNAAAAGRAEQLRKTLGDTRQPAVQGNSVTVSFGVTEIQLGDTPASMLRRADRALFEAKRMGRNLVVQLGTGLDEWTDSQKSAPPAEPFPGSELFLDRLLVTAVPLNIAVEKLRGFVVDHHLEILSVHADHINLQIEMEGHRRGRRRADYKVPFLVELTVAEQQMPIGEPEDRVAAHVARTRVRVTIRLKRAQDRRAANVAQQAARILNALQSYLMASHEPEEFGSAASWRPANLLAPALKMSG
jgi:diguanylate cyclase (GGDEF)-like protein/PAS domain S-box-containing protein